MGEIADMMLEGFLDEETGEVIDGDSPGYPRRQSDIEDQIMAQKDLAFDKAERNIKNRKKKARRRRALYASRMAAAAAVAKPAAE